MSTEYVLPDSKRFVDRTGYKSGMLTVVGYAGSCDAGSVVLAQIERQRREGTV
jgi:hypothetical protein